MLLTYQEPDFFVSRVALEQVNQESCIHFTFYYSPSLLLIWPGAQGSTPVSVQLPLLVGGDDTKQQ